MKTRQQLSDVRVTWKQIQGIRVSKNPSYYRTKDMLLKSFGNKEELIAMWGDKVNTLSITLQRVYHVIDDVDDFVMLLPEIIPPWNYIQLLHPHLNKLYRKLKDEKLCKVFRKYVNDARKCKDSRELSKFVESRRGQLYKETGGGDWPTDLWNVRRDIYRILDFWGEYCGQGGLSAIFYEHEKRREEAVWRFCKKQRETTVEYWL